MLFLGMNVNEFNWEGEADRSIHSWAMQIMIEFVGILKFPWTSAVIAVRRFRNRVRIVIPICADIELVMWVSCLNTIFWSRACKHSSVKSFSTLHCLGNSYCGYLALYSCHALSIISLPTLYTQWRVVYHWQQLGIEGHPIEYYRPSASWFALR